MTPPATPGVRVEMTTVPEYGYRDDFDALGAAFAGMANALSALSQAGAPGGVFLDAAAFYLEAPGAAIRGAKGIQERLRKNVLYTVKVWIPHMEMTAQCTRWLECVNGVWVGKCRFYDKASDTEWDHMYKIDVTLEELLVFMNTVKRAQEPYHDDYEAFQAFKSECKC